jgi:hypothetical protein
MKKQMCTYSEAFKEQAVSLLRSSSRSAADIEREVAPPQTLSGSWALRQGCCHAGIV